MRELIGGKHEEYKISNKVDVCIIKCICTYIVCGFVEMLLHLQYVVLVSVNNLQLLPV